jgi:protein CrcB
MRNSWVCFAGMVDGTSKGRYTRIYGDGVRRLLKPPAGADDSYRRTTEVGEHASRFRHSPKARQKLCLDAAVAALAQCPSAAARSPRRQSMRALRVTIFIGETDRWEHRPLYMAILDRLKRAGCGGATVTRGVAGFGLHANVIKTANILRLSVDLPMVITVVDAAEKIERLLPEMSAMLTGGLVTIDETQIYFHSAAFHGGLPRLRVGDVMSRDPESVAIETPIAEVVERLLVRDYTALPVVDEEQRVIGVISDADMLRAGLTPLSVSLHKATDPAAVRESLARLEHEGGTVRGAMTSPAVTVTPETDLAAAAHLMHTRHLKRLPVVDEQGRLAGVLGRLDILQSIASGYARRTVPLAHRLPQEHRTVAEIMEREVPTVAESATLADVVAKLLESATRDHQRYRHRRARRPRRTAGPPCTVAEPLECRDRPTSTAQLWPAGRRRHDRTSGDRARYCAGDRSPHSDGRPSHQTGSGRRRRGPCGRDRFAPGSAGSVPRCRRRTGRVMGNLLWIGFGGFLGANARYLLGGWIAARLGAAFPYGTLAINLSGSLVLGFLMGLLDARSVHPAVRAAFGLGFLGAYTTFSTFTYEAIRLVEEGSVVTALTYLIGSASGGLLAGVLGLAAGRGL